ncbi:hypothetical protein ACFXKW_32045 [Streptomyces sp. NPDC059193]|uniref:hypothetical protein n=1 Tax=Streptomyces sp. NPDC059193 TaxID=3346763 RepID=UPI00367BDC6B
MNPRASALRSLAHEAWVAANSFAMVRRGQVGYDSAVATLHAWRAEQKHADQLQQELARTGRDPEEVRTTAARKWAQSKTGHPLRQVRAVADTIIRILDNNGA